MSRGWTELLRSLGASLVGVAEAEAVALKGDLRSSSRQLAMAVALAAVAAFLLFWVVGAGAFVLFHVLRLWLPAWGAASIVLALFLLLAAVIAGVARQRFLAIEPPVETVRRHLDEHVSWWRSEVLVEEEAAQQLAEESVETPAGGEEVR